MNEAITEQTAQAIKELLEVASLHPGDLVVVGCSSSEVQGETIGTGSSMDVAGAIMDGLLPLIKEKGLFLGAQCCEHLNRAVIVEQAYAKAHGLEEVNVVPQPKAGGSFATTAWKRMDSPVAVEKVQGNAGMDIGGTLIGMHLKSVAVPVRLSVKQIGQAVLLCARTRPKFIGGCRAVYDETKL